MNTQQLAIICVATSVSAISFLCTATNLILIKRMKKWNGYLAIIWWMGLCQLSYDLTFPLHVSLNVNNITTAVFNGLQFFGGLSVSLWTNILALVVLRVVVVMRSPNILQNFNTLVVIALVPPAILCLCDLVFYRQDDHENSRITGHVYYWSRILSISLNFGAYIFITLRARTISRAAAFAPPSESNISEVSGIGVGISLGNVNVSTSSPSIGVGNPAEVATSRLTTTTSPTATVQSQQAAMFVLSQRMIYYPLLQCVSRLGAAIYEPLYGYEPFPGHTGTLQFSLALLYALLSPAAGIGYLIIFLVMQPRAFETFKKLCIGSKTRQHTSSSTGNGTSKLSSEKSSFVINPLGFFASSPAIDNGDDISRDNGKVNVAVKSHVSHANDNNGLSGTTLIRESYMLDDDELILMIHQLTTATRASLSTPSLPAAVTGSAASNTSSITLQNNRTAHDRCSVQQHDGEDRFRHSIESEAYA